jgi:ribosomal protein S6--L-glutamate ligase
MVRLAVATGAETFERMQEPLADRGVAVVGVSASERVVRPDDAPPDVDVGFVFPPRLMEGGLLDARLSVPWVNDRAAILRSRNKAEALARLDAAGVPTPETVVVSDPVDRGALVEAFEYFEGPVVVKPNSTTRGTGVARADDLDSFLGICDYLDLVHDYRATGDRVFLVQEFLPDARDFRAMLIDGAYVGAVERRLGDDAVAAGRWKHNVHRGAAAEGVDFEPARRDLVERAAAAIDIPWVGVDLLVTDDRTVVTETNARPTIDAATKYEPGFWDELAGLIRETADA